MKPIYYVWLENFCQRIVIIGFPSSGKVKAKKQNVATRPRWGLSARRWGDVSNIANNNYSPKHKDIKQNLNFKCQIFIKEKHNKNIVT